MRCRKDKGRIVEKYNKAMARKNFEEYEYPYFLKKDWIFPFSEIERNSTIILYGAGDVGQAYYNQVLASGYCKIYKWCDKNYETLRRYGIMVEPLQPVDNSKFDYVVIAVSDAATARDINRDLINANVEQTKVIWIGEIRYKLIDVHEDRIIQPTLQRMQRILLRRGIDLSSASAMEILSELKDDLVQKKRVILPRLVLQVSNVCTLRCINCNNLMPMFKRQEHIQVTDVIQDISIILGMIDGILTVEIIGGEPFAYPDLNRIVKYLQLQDKVTEIELTTNATIMPSNEIIHTLQNPKVFVQISQYGARNQRKDIALFLKKNQIMCSEIEDMMWIDSGGIQKRNRADYEIRNIYSACPASKNCKTLYNGKLYACARSASLYALNVLSDPTGYLVLKESDREDIVSFYEKTADLSCDYCDSMDGWRIIRAGKQ